MPERGKTLIMKFGGAAVAEPESFSHLATIVSKRLKDYNHITLVVSAMRGMTDQLIDLSKKVHSDPPRREYDMLVSAGERISIALLAMALAKEGLEAVSFTGSQSGIITTDDHADAKIVAVRPHRILEALDAGKIAIVAGFQGVSEKKEITTLGRGGSDTSAVALGVALGADCVEFYKDVDGIRINHPSPPIYDKITYECALEVVAKGGGKVLHPRAIELAQKNNLLLHVRSYKNIFKQGTLIF